MRNQQNNNGFKLWLTWVLAHLFSGGIVAVFIIFAIFTFALSGNETLTLILLSLALISVGAFIGIAQWVVLKKYTVGVKWFFMSAIGWPIGLVVGQVIGAGLIAATGGGTVLPLVLAFAGTGLGFMQWFVLRRFVSKSSLWIMSNVVAWWLSGIIWWRTIPPESMLGVMGLVIAAVSAGSLTGLTLVWLFRCLVNDGEQQPQEE